jgi:hypothetical protein
MSYVCRDGNHAYSPDSYNCQCGGYTIAQLSPDHDLDEIERQLDGSEPYYLRGLIAELRTARRALRGGL